MPRSSPKFGNEPVNEYYYEAWMESDEDERTGDVDGPGVFALFRVPNGEDPDNIDAYNAKQVDFEDQINASETIMLCTKMVGVIVTETSGGGVSADLYDNQDSLERDWQATLDDTMLESCDECHQEAEEYGKDMPIQHVSQCSKADC